MDNTPIQRTFLLGGYDLEMLTIKQMLEGHKDCDVLDKHLCWNNAFLSAYQNDLNNKNDHLIYGIELQEDIPITYNYFRIDHHNDWSDKPSALEQVADIIGVQLNRYQQLVAANDKGYIPAMMKLSATKEEIAEIRRKDRKAQGINITDEALAARSIENGLSRHGNLLVVKSHTHHFSTICDILFPYKNLLIYTDSEWVFYGEGKTKLLELCERDISQNKIFHGGGENGYIGAVNNAYSKNEIDLFVDTLMKDYDQI